MYLKQFYAKLRQLVLTCNLNSIDDEIKSQIISKCYNRKLRQRALKIPDITLNKLLNISNTMESDEVHAKQVDKLWNTSNEVYSIMNERKHIPHFKTNKQPQPARKLTCNSEIEFAIFVVVLFSS